jgi:putative transcriptional regulator
MAYIKAEVMTNFKRYLLCLLLALFSFWFTAARSAPIAETGRAAVAIPEKAVFADLLPLQASSSLASPGNPQLNSELSKGKFLIASRQLKDPRFAETVILLIHHDSDGTVGLIVNLPTTIKLSDLVPEIKEQQGKEHFTYIGGPVGMNQVLLLLRSRNKPEGCQWIFDDIYVSASRSVFEQLIKKPSGETTFRAYAGYAGWGAGQLEREVLQGGWQIAGADAEVIFKKPSSEVWKDLNLEKDPSYIEL